jgi:beta-1,2-mannobiose phosphorylase / 1,2-beta-oligomannan phosphorylase
MSRFRVVELRGVRTEAASPLSEMYQLSPYVWEEPDGLHLALRAVNHAENPAEKVARAYHGTGDEDGRRFQMDDEPFLAPDPDPAADDHDGCEDPAVLLAEDGRYWVFYTAWNQTRQQGCLHFAVGSRLGRLEKRGRALPRSESYALTKEPAFAPLENGWRMLFEYSQGGASLLGAAQARSLEGPWEYLDDPLRPREGKWDGFHLSPGPILRMDDGSWLLFYNGGLPKPSWRIGYAVLGPDLKTVQERSESPLVEPGPVKGEDTDIAFAASAVRRGREIWLYYSISDRRLMRAVLAPA